MENVNNIKLKKGLSKIKSALTGQVGPVWKLKKNEVINKIKKLNYKYDSNKGELTTNSMIRKLSRVKL